MAASFTTGPGQGGGATPPLISSAFHRSCIQSCSLPNIPKTLTEDPAAPEVVERTTWGALSPDGVGHCTAPAVAAVGFAADPAAHVAMTLIFGCVRGLEAGNARTMSSELPAVTERASAPVMIRRRVRVRPRRRDRSSNP